MFGTSNDKKLLETDWDVDLEENTEDRLKDIEQDLYGSKYPFSDCGLGIKRRVEHIEDALKSHKERIKALENYLGIEFKNAPEIGSYEEVEND